MEWNNSKWKWNYVLIYILVLLVSTLEALDESICYSMEINFHADLSALRGCRIVVGHLRIANLPANIEKFNYQSDVEEITDYLLVYRANGLESLEKIFPKLKLIRGQELLYDEYALVVAENRFMRNLGLTSLLRVQKGNIRIESNPIMCFVETINWVYLLENAKTQHFSLKNNRHPNHCPLCQQSTNDNDNDNNNNNNNNTLDHTNIEPHFLKYCWNTGDAYQKKAYEPPSVNCNGNCHPAMGCKADNGACCDRNCLSSCSYNYGGCTLCANLFSQGKCVDACRLPSLFLINNRECVTNTMCRNYGLIPHNSLCIKRCPKYYNTHKEPNGLLTCEMPCEGTYVINKIEDLNTLEECITINGSLEIELTNIKTKVSDLEKVLFKIKEIKGYLKIIRSPQLVSLNFLKNLDSIRGDTLIENKYALYVVNNPHLEHIWHINQNVAIHNGRIYFHLNPRLCYDKILKLQPMLKTKKILNSDVSPNSNGERVICDKAVISLNATVEDKNATAVRIKVNPMSADDKDVIVGYLHHYKEAPVQNVTMYDGRHGCGHDNWLMDISAGKNIRHVISNLLPNTQYSYFVKTLTMTDYHMQIDAYSKIQYFRTLPDRPGKVRKIYFHAPSAGEIVLHWWPPRFPNGEIEYFLINYENVTKTESTSLLESLNAQMQVDESCECNIKNPDNSGPPPEDENYYNREQITYDEALPNILFITRHQVEMEQNAKKKRKMILATTPTPKNMGKHRRAAGESGKENTVAKETAEEKEDREAEERYNKFRMEMERKALAEQDTGIDNFLITHPWPVCEMDNPSAQFQLEHSCVPRENYTGLKVPGSVYTFTLKNINPEHTYRISIRACVKNLINGCGNENSIYAETVSKNFEKYVKNIRLTR